MRLPRQGQPPNRKWATAAFAVYVAAIAGSNWLITHAGIPTATGVHLTPVGFGLLAPSGVWAAAVSFPARDVTQRLGGRWLGVTAIGVGAALSWAISDPRIAVASGLTYLLLGDRRLRRVHANAAPLVHTRRVRVRMRRHRRRRVLFLRLAGIPAGTAAVAGLILGKFWVQVAAVPVTWELRRAGPLAVTA